MFDSLSFSELAFPFFCVGAFFATLLSVIIILRYFHEKIYYALLALTAISLVYGICELGIRVQGSWLGNEFIGMIFYHLQSYSLIALLIALPLFLKGFLQGPPMMDMINQIFIWIGSVLGIAMVVASFVWPESFTSTLTASGHFPLLVIYGSALLIMVFYGLLATLIYPQKELSLTDRILYPLAFLLVFYFGLANLVESAGGPDFSPFPSWKYPRLLVGIVFFLTLLYFAIMKNFVRKARMEEAANIRAIKSQQELIYSSSHDQLSGLKNRNSFYLHLSKTIHQSVMSENVDNMALIVIDVDNLTSINNSFGHSVGDQVLRVVAERLQHYLRVTDQVFRIGGDEFAAVLHKLTEPSLAGMAADKLIRAFAEPVELETSMGERNIYVGISMGISCFPQDSEDPKELINHADMALYEAKKLKNSFRYYGKDMELAAEQRVNLTGIIRKALRQDLFRLHFQPLTDMNGQVKGAEALIRLNFEGRDIPPSLLIPVAESSGLILRLGEWVIEEAIRSRQEMSSSVSPEFFLSINLSVKQLKDANLIPFITHCLRRYNQPTSAFRFEITESSLMENFDSYLPVLQEMKELGMKIVLDDFGTGYSSLGYLKNLPVDTVKIDKTFLVNFPQDRQNSAIIESIFNLAGGLMMDVVVEGVENSEQRNHLSPYQYSHLQGFFFSKPLSMEDFMRYLRT